MIVIRLLRPCDLWHAIMQTTISVLTTATMNSGMTTATAVLAALSVLLVSVQVDTETSVNDQLMLVQGS